MRIPLCAVIGLAGLALLAAPASAVTIDWVLVGDPGNAPDTASNCYAANYGSVAAPYFISKFEVTNAQYAEFLNAKAAADLQRSTTRTWPASTAASRAVGPPGATRTR